MGIGPRIRAARTERRMTLAELAGDALSVSLVSKIERDLVNPSLQTLELLAARLGVAAGTLLEAPARGAIRPARGVLDAARARLLMGDPAEAAAEATTAAAQVSERPVAARLLAVAAEAALAIGNAGQAAIHLRDATALISDRAAPAAQIELMWVLGALERRRGALVEAERTWTSCLSGLEDPPAADPWWLFLRASVLAGLGGLAESRGDAEQARNLVARAASIAAGVAQAVGPANTLLAAWGRKSMQQGDVTSDDHAPPAGPHAALALAVIAGAERLSRRLTQEAARLERTAWTPESRAPDVSTTRGLR